MNNFSEILMRAVYKTSSYVNAPENQNEDWQAGYKVGVSTHSMSGEDARFNLIDKAWKEYGSPTQLTPEFKNWKRGFWAGVFLNH